MKHSKISLDYSWVIHRRPWIIHFCPDRFVNQHLRKYWKSMRIVSAMPSGDSKVRCHIRTNLKMRVTQTAPIQLPSIWKNTWCKLSFPWLRQARRHQHGREPRLCLPACLQEAGMFGLGVFGLLNAVGEDGGRESLGWNYQGQSTKT